MTGMVLHVPVLIALSLDWSDEHLMKLVKAGKLRVTKDVHVVVGRNTRNAMGGNVWGWLNILI
jgi:hypothetical protein